MTQQDRYGSLTPRLCGRAHFPYPWWCRLPFCHTGPCALEKKWWRFWG